MRKWVVVAAGFMPLVVGVTLDALITACPANLSMFYGIINLAALVLWTAAGFFLRFHASTAFKATVLAHLPALVALLLIWVQELVLSHYWLNFIGIGTQLFYLPLIYLPGRVLFFGHRMPWVYLGAFLSMTASFWLGGYLRERYAP